MSLALIFVVKPGPPMIQKVTTARGTADQIIDNKESRYTDDSACASGSASTATMAEDPVGGTGITANDGLGKMAVATTAAITLQKFVSSLRPPQN